VFVCVCVCVCVYYMQVVRLPCFHAFHYDCAVRYLSKAAMSSKVKQNKGK
jgi:hypothetical protein